MIGLPRILQTTLVMLTVRCLLQSQKFNREIIASDMSILGVGSDRLGNKPSGSLGFGSGIVL